MYLLGEIIYLFHETPTTRKKTRVSIRPPRRSTGPNGVSEEPKRSPSPSLVFGLLRPPPLLFLIKEDRRLRRPRRFRRRDGAVVGTPMSVAKGIVVCRFLFGFLAFSFFISNLLCSETANRAFFACEKGFFFPTDRTNASNLWGGCPLAFFYLFFVRIIIGEIIPKVPQNMCVGICKDERCVIISRIIITSTRG